MVGNCDVAMVVVPTNGAMKWERDDDYDDHGDELIRAVSLIKQGTSNHLKQYGNTILAQFPFKIPF